MNKEGRPWGNVIKCIQLIRVYRALGVLGESAENAEFSAQFAYSQSAISIETIVAI